MHHTVYDYVMKDISLYLLMLISHIYKLIFLYLLQCYHQFLFHATVSFLPVMDHHHHCLHSNRPQNQQCHKTSASTLMAFTHPRDPILRLAQGQAAHTVYQVIKTSYIYRCKTRLLTSRIILNWIYWIHLCLTIPWFNFLFASRLCKQINCKWRKNSKLRIILEGKIPLDSRFLCKHHCLNVELHHNQSFCGANSYSLVNF